MTVQSFVKSRLAVAMLAVAGVAASVGVLAGGGEEDREAFRVAGLVVTSFLGPIEHSYALTGGSSIVTPFGKPDRMKPPHSGKVLSLKNVSAL